MQVSVIIPVYQAATFLEEAVRSALIQPETGEVLLIEDGSTDNSWNVCQELEKSDARIRLLTHAGRVNMGAAESRNLGMANASCEYLAFLDADDYYLPGRFVKARGIFETHKDADGVYGTIGVNYSDPELRDLHLSRLGKENTGISIKVPPNLLYRELATGKHGHLHLNGIVLRKHSIDSTLLFDGTLRQCQDSDWILRLSRFRILYPTDPDHIVAIRRVHSGNRVHNEPLRIEYQRKFLYKAIANHFYGATDKFANLYLVSRYVSWSGSGWMRRIPAISSVVIMTATAFYLLIHPGILLKILFPGRSDGK